MNSLIFIFGKLYLMSCIVAQCLIAAELQAIDPNGNSWEKLIKDPTSAIFFEYTDMMGEEGEMKVDDAPMAWLIAKINMIEVDGRSIKVSLLPTDNKLLADSAGSPVITQNNVEFKIFMVEKDVLRPNRNLAWAKLIFQIFLYENRKASDSAKVKLVSGEFAMDDYVKAVSKTRFEIARSCSLFYKQEWKPWCLSEGILPPSPTPWFASSNLDNFEAWEKNQIKSGNLELWRRMAKVMIEEGNN